MTLRSITFIALSTCVGKKREITRNNRIQTVIIYERGALIYGIKSHISTVSVGRLIQNAEFAEIEFLKFRILSKNLRIMNRKNNSN